MKLSNIISSKEEKKETPIAMLKRLSIFQVTKQAHSNKQTNTDH